MSNTEKLAILEEMLDIEEGTLKEDTLLADIDEWDSMAIISLIALLDEKFGKSLSSAQIKQFKVVQDILNQME